jgi:hypothetical protein
MAILNDIKEKLVGKMPSKRGRMRDYTPTKFDKWSNEFWTLPSKDKPATTTQASIRNAVDNVKKLPGDIKTAAQKIGSVLTAPSGRRRKK